MVACWQRSSELCSAVAVLGHAEHHGDWDAFPKICSLAGAEAAHTDSSG